MTKEQQTQIDTIKELATELYDGIWEDAAMWSQLPQPQFFNKTALQLVAEGEGKLVIEWLEVRTGKKAGAAF